MSSLRVFLASLRFVAVYFVGLPLLLALLFGTATIVLSEAAGDLSLLLLAGALLGPALVAAALPGPALRTLNYLLEGLY